MGNGTVYEDTESGVGVKPPQPARNRNAGGGECNETACSSQGKYHLCSRDFSIFYGTNEAVRKVNMNIKSGLVTAIIGPSGCGKSTFLRAVNRMNDLIPDCRAEGELNLDGYNIYSSQIDVVSLRKRTGMVFQKPNPFPKSIYDNIAYGPRLHGVKNRSTLDELVESSLRKAILWDEVKDRLKANALGLSGGQQQRLCLARALAVDPEVLLMDEPTSALDPRATAHIENLIFDLRGKYTILIVTHNMQQASRVSDQTAFFYEGILVEMNDTRTIFTNPENEQTQEYITGRFG